MHDVSSGVTGHVCFHCRDHFGLGEKGLCPCDPPGGGCCFVIGSGALGVLLLLFASGRFFSISRRRSVTTPWLALMKRVAPLDTFLETEKIHRSIRDGRPGHLTSCWRLTSCRRRRRVLGYTPCWLVKLLSASNIWHPKTIRRKVVSESFGIYLTKDSHFVTRPMNHGSLHFEGLWRRDVERLDRSCLWTVR